jgi:hypothetical protein
MPSELASHLHHDEPIRPSRKPAIAAKLSQLVDYRNQRVIHRLLRHILMLDATNAEDRPAPCRLGARRSQ